jgi:hypothetical protein
MRVETKSGFIIKSDGLCISLYLHKQTDKGKSYDSFIGHFPNLYFCLLRLVEEGISQSEADTIEGLRGDLFSLRKEVFEAVKAITEHKDKKKIVQMPLVESGVPVNNTKKENDIKFKPVKRKAKKKETLSDAKMTVKRKKDLNN